MPAENSPEVRRGAANPNPLLKANWFSNLFFCWVLRVIWHGYKQRLQAKDVYDILPNLTSKHLFERFERSWTIASKHSLLLSLWKLQWKSIMKYFIAITVQEVCNILQPFLITIMVVYLQDNSQVDSKIAYLCAAGSVLCTLLAGISYAWHVVGWYTIAMQLRSMLTAAIYRKVLRISNASLSKISSGHIVTLVATDVEKFHYACNLAGTALFSIVAVPIILGFLSLDYGLTVIGGVILLIVFVLLFVFIANKSKTIRFQVARCTDSRVLIMSEILAAMRVIKMYCWEKPFAKIIMKHRREEIQKLIKMIFVKSLNGSISNNMSKIGVMIMVSYQVWTGEALELRGLLRLIAWWELLRWIGCYAIAFTLCAVSEMIASTNRIQEFLQLPEKGLKLSDTKENHSQFHVCLSEFSAMWTDTFSIDNIGLTVPKGSLVAIVGPVGAGKTSLLMAILGELPASSGSLYVSGSVGYVPQEPWIFSDSLRANILFGSDLNYDKYTETIQACCLQPDISSMTHGDLTLVGERGLKLSGGQKARINLARAMYRDADIYLLDDPLSAVDAKVRHQIFDRCILEKWAGKTRILVTHKLNFLNQMDHIYVIKEGKLVANGSYEDLTKQVDLKSVISWYKTMEKTAHEDTLPVEKDEKIKPSTSEDVIEEEECVEGKIAMKTFSKFLKAGHGFILFPIVLLLLCLYRMTFIGSDIWLTLWVADYDKLLQYGNISVPLDVMSSEFIDWAKHRTWVNVALILATLLFVVLANFLLGLHIAVASKNLHDKMFERVLRAPVAFFDTNPVGRILNRFSRDLGFVDDQISFVLMMVVPYAVTFVSICILMCVSNPWSLIPTVPLFGILFLLRQISICAMREIKRIEANDRSPVFSHLSATLQGLSIIRAFGMEHQLTDTFDHYQDTQTASWYLFIALFRTFGLYCDMLLGVYYAAILVVMFVFPQGGDASGLIGISLIHAVISTIGYFQFVMRLTAELESLMTSVERIGQYSCLDQEAPEHTDVLPPSNWPQKGQIRFDNLWLTYKEGTPHVLKDINLNIEGQQKIGIVGRTGAGKSSLFSAILRLYEPEGHIWIDGIDVTKLGLADLRQAISVIPQDPVLFCGTFRYNLDPLSDYNDQQIWKALEEVQLRNKVLRLKGGLDASMAESGSNLSVGERQLICLARAILRQNKIIIIDEATANVDHRTDGLIQRAIREKFDQRTLLCIAHRLNTIVDSHNVLVLEEGRIVQFGHPHVLMKDTAGAFHQMAQYAGPDQFLYLKNAAKQAFLKHTGGLIKDTTYNVPMHVKNTGNDDIIENTRL